MKYGKTSAKSAGGKIKPSKPASFDAGKVKGANATKTLNKPKGK